MKNNGEKSGLGLTRSEVRRIDREMEELKWALFRWKIWKGIVISWVNTRI